MSSRTTIPTRKPVSGTAYLTHHPSIGMLSVGLRARITLLANTHSYPETVSGTAHYAYHPTACVLSVDTLEMTT
jgi:hypothetical protein